MAIYYCPLCNKKFFIDNIKEAGETISCSLCGSSINTKQLVEYSQKRQTTIIEKTNTTSQSDEDTYAANTIPTSKFKEDTSLNIQRKQLEELEAIKNMLKFFTILTVISLVLSFISSALVMFN